MVLSRPFWLRPSHILRGSVSKRGLARNWARTTSSKENTKEKMAAAMIAGTNSGRITSNRVRNWVAPSEADARS
ncbi:hypothetical protein D3C71_2043220 [compost metagenome]